MVAAHGFLGYHDRRPGRTGVLGPLTTLADEFVPTEQAQPHPAPSAVLPIPSGLSLNWRYGARRLVPPSATLRRCRHLFDGATAQDDVAHLSCTRTTSSTARGQRARSTRCSNVRAVAGGDPGELGANEVQYCAGRSATAAT